MLETTTSAVSAQWRKSRKTACSDNYGTRYICKYLLTYTISIPHRLFSRRQQCFYHLIISRHGKLVKAKRQGFPCPIIYCFPCKTHRRFHEGACRTDGIDSAPPPTPLPSCCPTPLPPLPVPGGGIQARQTTLYHTGRG